MTRDPDRTDTLVPASIDDSVLEAGLAAAFGPNATESRRSQSSLLCDDPISDVPKLDSTRYQLHGEIARGGMGIVLKGRDQNLHRDLAVKVLKSELVASDSARQRFVEEARVTGQLQHPGIVPIYDLGQYPDGRPFFAMKLVKGHTLATLLAERTPVADAPGSPYRGRFLKVFEQVCHAIAYAHSMRVIHRDLKPANIMVGRFNEVQVMDWGLAKVLPPSGVGDEDRANRRAKSGGLDDPSVIQTARSGSGAGSETQAGSVLGTPAFMPPEQAGGEIDKVDERADVFGLGAMLCAILTGEPPYVADTAEATRLMAIRAELAGAHARLAQCGADGELIELCRQCLAPDPAARPRNASVVAEAMTAYLTGVEERAHRAEVERAAAVAREAEARKRRRLQRRLAAAILLTVAVAATAGTWFVTDRSARSTELNRAWSETQRLIPTTANGSPTQRLATTRAALSAARSAEAQLGLGVGDSDFRNSVRAAIARLEEQERDLQLLIDLETAWLRRAEHTAEKRTFEPALAAPFYADAFRRAGLDVLSVDANEAAEAVRGRKGLRVELAAALDDWADSTPNDSEKTRLREVARLADPDSPGARLKELIKAKDARGIAAFIRELDPRTLPPTVAVDLARQLWLQGRLPNQAAALLRAVHDHHPNDFWVNTALGEVYGATDPPRLDERIRFLTAALAVRPDVPVVYTVLGYAYMSRGRDAEAMAAFRRAVALNSHCFGARMALIVHADPVERAQYYAGLEKLARDLPEDVGVQRDLGEMYFRQKRFVQAADQFRKVTELTPQAWPAWANLGTCLDQTGRPEEAAAAFREVTRLTPGNTEIRNKLLAILRRIGAAGEELQAYKEWYDRLPADSPTRGKSGPQLKYLEQQAELERRLSDFRDGRVKPATTGEAIGLARLCQAKKFYPHAVQFFTQAFERNPSIADNPQSADRYNAACAAARAAAEGGPADVQARFRKQALDWLRADLAARTSRAKSDAERAAFRKFLRETVLPDSDLTGVQSFWSVAHLPADERAAWAAFWAEVDATEKAMTPKEAAPKDAKK